MPHYALAIDLDQCTGCMSCEVACKQDNGVALGQYFNRVQRHEQGEFPKTKQFWLPMNCQQCADSPCVHVCPTTASYKNEDGIVMVDKEKCIGCLYCTMACPYGVRSFNKKERVVEKCTLCVHLTYAGKQPACVQNCPTKCRYYGDMDDPNSDVSKLRERAGEENIKHLKDIGNHPQQFYVLSEKTGTWEFGD